MYNHALLPRRPTPVISLPALAAPVLLRAALGANAWRTAALLLTVAVAAQSYRVTGLTERLEATELRADGLRSAVQGHEAAAERHRANLASLRATTARLRDSYSARALQAEQRVGETLATEVPQSAAGALDFLTGSLPTLRWADE